VNLRETILGISAGYALELIAVLRTCWTGLPIMRRATIWDHALASSLPNPLHSLKYWARDQMKNQDCLSEHVQISLVQILQKADQSSKENRTVQHYQKQDGKAKST
jgi:hypothetical protein